MSAPVRAPVGAATTTDPGEGVLGDGSTAGTTGRAWWRRWWLPLVVIILIVLVALLLAAGIRTGGRPLDPVSATPGGSKALAQILGREGVQVRRATRFTEARTLVGDGTQATLLVTDPELIGLDNLSKLRTMAPTLVLVEPNAETLEELAPAITPAGVVEDREVEPGCSAEVAEAGSALGGGHLYRAAGDGTVCYGTEAGTGSWASVGTGPQHVYVLGQSKLLTNDQLGQAGNAAVALRTLGRNRTLVWYLPNPVADADTGGEGGGGGPERSTQELLDERAPWLASLQVQLLFVVLVALFWRGRRLGRLVREPLPVAVRSAETQEGRARLYRRSRARGRAGATLRTAALRRIARQLAVPSDAGPDQVVALAARASGWPGEQVAAVLTGAEPADDAELVRLASELDRLERAVGGGAGRPGWR